MWSPVREYEPAWFHPRILVGSGTQSIRLLSRHKITAVINCAFPQDCPEVTKRILGPRYVCLQAYDSPHVNILDWFPAFEEAMYRFLRETTGIVYVHCQAGMNRSAFLALAFVCKNFGMDLTTTVTLTKSQRPIIFQNQVFMAQVQSFINGHLSRAENSRLIGGSENGNAGLGPSGHRPESAGNGEPTRDSSSGTPETA